VEQHLPLQYGGTAEGWEDSPHRFYMDQTMIELLRLYLRMKNMDRSQVTWKWLESHMDRELPD